MKNAFFVLLASLLFYTCTSPISPPPPNLIPEKKMTGILFDLHVAEARIERMGIMLDTAAIYYKQLQGRILKKHGVNQKQFYISYDYYLHNVSELDKIYEKVIDSLMVQEVEFDKRRDTLQKAPDTLRVSK
ncbi:MAG: DUF4296 domain-containing protein [Adhaeribacter sp.]